MGDFRGRLAEWAYAIWKYERSKTTGYCAVIVTLSLPDRTPSLAVSVRT